MNISLIILSAVFVLIAVRKIAGIHLHIWQIMLFGAAGVLLTGEISPVNALKSINPDVMLFLFGMFVVGNALEKSGYLSHLSYRLFSRAKNTNHLIILILFSMGMFSAFLMNDTIAIIGTPLMIYFARKHGIPPKLLLMALAFAVTTGSVMSPIGNPQNLLIAITGDIPNPFITFFKYLALPTIINLFLAYFILRLFYKDQFQSRKLVHFREQIKDPELAFISKISLALIIILIGAKILVVMLNVGINFSLTYIALISSIPVIIFSRRRGDMIKGIDWHTLVFFTSMFILMESVWDSGFFQSLMENQDMNLNSIPAILLISVIMSQFVSNVPFVALYLPIVMQAKADLAGMMALAAGSTIAGNLSILGAASNIIIIQNAEKHGETLTFLEFLKIGVPFTVVSVLVYLVFFLI